MTSHCYVTSALRLLLAGNKVVVRFDLSGAAIVVGIWILPSGRGVAK